MVPAKETCSSSIVTCRPSAASRAASAARAGSNRAIAASTSRSTAVAEVRCANGASCWSTYAAASRDKSGMDGGLRDPPGPPRRQVPGLHPPPQPGSRCRSSRACPIRCFAETVEMPSTAPNSAMQNSATNGAPTPATGSSCSEPPGSRNAAASSTDVAGCRSAHSHAATNRSASCTISGSTRRAREREHRGRGVGKLARGDRHTENPIRDHRHSGPGDQPDPPCCGQRSARSSEHSTRHPITA